MMTTTTYTKTVAVWKSKDGTTYYAHGSMSSVGGGVYLTTDISEAKDYSHGGVCPEGFRLKKVTKTQRHRCLGGGWINECGPTGP